MQQLLKPPHAFNLHLCAAFFMLGAAFVVQFAFGFAPCTLCVWQRWPYVLVITAACVGLLRPRRLLLECIIAAYGGAALLAGYHSGVEWGWWRFESACSGSAAASSLEALEEMLKAAPLVRCDEPAFTLAGLSMAAWHLLAALMLVGVTVWQRRFYDASKR